LWAALKSRATVALTMHGTPRALVIEVEEGDLERALELTRRVRIGHNMPLDRRPFGLSLYGHLAAFLAKSLDLTQRGPSASSLDGAAPTMRTDPKPISCPH
jgi:hypothetical protein